MPCMGQILDFNNLRVWQPTTCQKSFTICLVSYINIYLVIRKPANFCAQEMTKKGGAQEKQLHHKCILMTSCSKYHFAEVKVAGWVFTSTQAWKGTKKQAAC